MNPLWIATIINFVMLCLLWFSVHNALKRMSPPAPVKLSKELRDAADREEQLATAEGESPFMESFYARQRHDEQFAQESTKAARELAQQGKWPPRES